MFIRCVRYSLLITFVDDEDLCWFKLFLLFALSNILLQLLYSFKWLDRVPGE